MGMKAAGNSKQDLLTHMNGANSTLGWDALIALDRSTLNTALREQYLASFSNDAYLPDITLITPLSGDSYRVMNNCTFSVPVISFENASIVDSNPRLSVEMEMVQGSELSVIYGATQPKAVSMTYVNALNTPRLTFNSDLSKIWGMGALAAVAIDLHNGSDYNLSSGSGLTEPGLLGEALKAEFGRWSAVQRQWILNKVEDPQAVLSVKDFRVRCQPAPGAALRGAQNYGDGAVVLFIVSTPGSYGRFPSTAEGFKYLVPDDAEVPYTVTTVINRARVAPALGREALARYQDGPVRQTFIGTGFETGEYTQFSYGTGAFHREGSFKGPTTWPDYEIFFQESSLNPEWNLRAGTGFGLSLASVIVKDTVGHFGEISISFTLANFIDFVTVFYLDANGQPQRDTSVRVKLTGGIYVRGVLLFDEPAQRFRFRGLERDAHVVATGVEALNAPIPTEEFLNAVSQMATASASTIAAQLSERELSLSLLPLNGLLFSGDYATRLTEAARPYDILLLGHLARDATAFEITTPLLILAAGQQHRFTVSGAEGVTWKVENLPGEEAFDAGSITSDGVYTAPAKALIKGSQVRVKITASKGSGHATALVTVVSKGININPLVQMVSIGATCDLSAGALDGATLTWRKDEAASGSLSPLSGGYYLQRFTAPTTARQEGGLELIPISVTASGASEVAYVGLAHNPAPLAIETGAIGPQGHTVALTAFAGDVIMPNLLWMVAAGSGDIDPDTGELVVPDDPQEPFVLVTAHHKTVSAIYGYLLLPLPLAQFPAKPPEPPVARGSRVVMLA